MTALQSKTSDAYSKEDLVAQRQLKFLELVLDKAKDNPTLLGYLQVLSKQFGEISE